VEKLIGDVPASSIRSYLRLNTPELFARMDRAQYSLAGFEANLPSRPCKIRIDPARCTKACPGSCDVIAAQACLPSVSVGELGHCLPAASVRPRCYGRAPVGIGCFAATERLGQCHPALPLWTGRSSD
jgi:hypothetical protein